MYRLISIAAIMLLFVSGCSTYNAPRYGVSTSNVLMLKKVNEKANAQVKVNEFTAVGDLKQEIMCRAAGPVRANPGTSYQKYIRDALQDELLLADMYSNDSQTVIDGRLEYIDFSSAMTEAHWNIGLRLSSNKFNTFVIDHKYHFSGTYVAETACNSMANALLPAVQDLIKQITDHPEFRKVLGGNSAAVVKSAPARAAIGK